MSAAAPAAPQPSATPPPTQSTQDILDRFELEKRAKRAKYMRELRKKKTQQMDAIREALCVPIEVVIQRKEERERKLEEEKEEQRTSRRGNSASSEGSLYVSNAPKGRGKIILMDPEDLMHAVEETQVAEALGSPGDDGDDSDAAYFAVSDRRYVKPEGSGADEEGESVDVKLNDFDEYPLMQELFDIYFVSDGAGNFVCRLCGASDGWERHAKLHLEQAHGEETNPAHDPRFGNVIYSYRRSGRKPPNVEKRVREAKPAGTA